METENGIQKTQYVEYNIIFFVFIWRVRLSTGSRSRAERSKRSQKETKLKAALRDGRYGLRDITILRGIFAATIFTEIHTWCRELQRAI